MLPQKQIDWRNSDNYRAIYKAVSGMQHEIIEHDTRADEHGYLLHGMDESKAVPVELKAG